MNRLPLACALLLALAMGYAFDKPGLVPNALVAASAVVFLVASIAGKHRQNAANGQGSAQAAREQE